MTGNCMDYRSNKYYKQNSVFAKQASLSECD